MKRDDGDRLGEVVDLRSRPGFKPDMAALARAQVASARERLGLSHAEFAEVLKPLLGWAPSAGVVENWETSATPPGDVLIAAGVITQSGPYDSSERAGDSDPLAQLLGRRFADVDGVFATRSEFSSEMPTTLLFEGAETVDAAGLSLNVLLVIATYDETIRFNIMTINGQLAVIQPLPTGRPGRRVPDLRPPPPTLRRRPLSHLRAGLRLAMGPEPAGMTDYTEFLPVAVEAIDQGAKLIRTGKPGAHTAKGDRDYATELDFSVERHLRQFLADATPEIGFLGEEDGGTDGDGLWWTLDPIDGTVNFAHHMPLCAISLALMSGDQPVLGVIDLPFLGDRYTAVEGHGAHKNNEPIHVSNCARLADAVVAIGDYAVGEGSTEKNRQRLALTAALAGSVLRVRMLGSAAIDLAWVAEGKLDASITLSNQPWDMAAGVVIARQAEALVIDTSGFEHSIRSCTTLAVPNMLSKHLLQAIATAGA